MKKYSLSDFYTKLKLDIRKGISYGSIRELYEDKDYYNFDFDVFLPSIKKNLQRPLVWTLLQKQELVLSVLKDMQLPSISVIIHKVYTEKNSEATTTFQIIDGKQRLTTLLSFFNNEFYLTVKGKGCFYKDLDNDAQFRFWNYNPVFDVVYSRDYLYNQTISKSVSDIDKISWFELINFAGTLQDKQHLENLRS